jgi:hypothetical protein
MYFSKYNDNLKRLFKDDTGDYNPIGCVAATLNNSVLLKIHISCDETVRYFVCKQSEYLLKVCSPRFLNNCGLCAAFDIFNMQYNKCYQNQNKIKILFFFKSKRIRLQKRIIKSKPNLDKANTHMK